MALFEKKMQAYALRRSGLSVGAIASQLEVSKSTASLWCRSIPLTKQQQHILRKNTIAGGYQGRLRGAEINRKRKLDRITLHQTTARKIINRLNRKDLLYAGLGVYWGEGVKADSSQAAVVNSNPKIIAFSAKWLTECLGVQKIDFHPRIFISATHRSREAILIKYWSKILDIPIQQFGRTIFINSENKKIYENHDSYYGVLALRIRRSTDLKYRILALIEALSEAQLPG